MQQPDPFLHLLTLLAHEMMNGHPSFREPLNHTYVLSPYASSCFGASRLTGKAALGVPPELWDKFASCRWQYLAVPKGDTAVYLLASVHDQIKAIRIHQRAARLQWLVDDKSCLMVSLEPGRAKVCKEGFSLPVRQTDGLEWERIVAPPAPKIRGLDALALLPRA